MVRIREDNVLFAKQQKRFSSTFISQYRRPFLSVVIPAFNEETRLPATLEQMESMKNRYSLEIIVVCDGCTDNTPDVALRWTDRLPLKVIAYPENKGKGYAVQQGILSAQGQIIAFMDADGSTPPSELMRLASSITTGAADIVIGSRRHRGILLKKQPLYRRLFSKLLSITVRGILSLPFQDTQCGFKLFRRDCAMDLFGEMQSSGFEFDLEILYLAYLRKIRILETGVIWEDRIGSKVSPVRDGIRMIRAILSIRRNTLQQHSFNLFSCFRNPNSPKQYGRAASN